MRTLQKRMTPKCRQGIIILRRHFHAKSLVFYV
uniref:Uncharacterized protein n=1 Tax=Siphoviridae sp. ctF7F8 TaxID=2826211 RepID=A0A8S5MJ81_9CAUD|nr:MAG TPA: hypothetical protein [Siphoviridae sp. ctF7F8]